MGMLLFYFGGSFLLHLLWENAQAPLFAGYESFSRHFGICLKATLTGDMFAMALIYGVLMAVHRDVWWVTRREAYLHPATWLLPVLTGVFVALVVELRALYVDHRWAYGLSMPLIPFFKVGLTPVLQMIVVPLLTLLISWYQCFRRKMSLPTHSASLY